MMLDLLVNQVGFRFTYTKLQGLVVILHKDVDPVSFNCTPCIFSDKCAQPF